MVEDKFKHLYELSKQIHEKMNRQVYDELKREGIDLGDYDIFIKKLEQDSNKEKTEEEIKRVQDTYIFRDTIKKDNFELDLVLFHYPHSDPVKLDENYKVLPREEKELYEYQSAISLDTKEGCYTITGIYNGREEDIDIAKVKYNEIKDKINNLSEEELLNEIEDRFLKELDA